MTPLLRLLTTWDFTPKSRFPLKHPLVTLLKRHEDPLHEVLLQLGKVMMQHLALGDSAPGNYSCKI